MLSLTEALETGRLDEFVAQEEARGLGPVNRTDFAADVAALVRAPQSGDQTSRSACDDGSSGTRTRRGSGPRTFR